MPEERRKLLQPVIENVGWMKERLDAIRDEIGEDSAVIEYNNGGGQSGIRVNPLYKEYESMWTAYSKGISIILSESHAKKEEVKNAEPPKTVLEILRAKKA